MITLIITLAVVGLLVWLITTYVPMPAIIKKIIVGIAVICIVLYVLQAFGLLSSIHDVGVPQLR